jgi:uncharacterized protein (DUF2237 family)
MTKPRDPIHPIAIQVQDVEQSEKNVLGGELALHCHSPKTGFYRDGYCRTGEADTGSHVIAATVTDEFLEFTKSRGNDLQTARPMYDFPGLKAGDRWCLCALRWREAHDAGFAPPVVLEATHAKALKYIPLERLKQYQKP